MADVLGDIAKLEQKLGIQTRITPGRVVDTVQPKAPAPASGFSFGNLGKSAVTLAGQAVKGVADAAVGGFTGLYGDARSNLTLDARTAKLNNTEAQLASKQADIINRYKTKQITKDQYNAELKALLAEGEQQSQAAKQIADSYAGYGQVAGHAAQAGGTVLAVAAPFATAGVGVGAIGNIASKVPGAGRLAKAVDSTLAAGRGITAGEDVVGKTAQVAGKLARNALVVQPTVNQPGQIVNDVKSNNVGAIATDAAVLAAPFLIGKVAGLVSKLGPELKTAFTGTKGVLDEALGKRVIAFAKDNPGLSADLKRMELFTLAQPDVQAGRISAAEKLASHLASIGVDPRTTPIKKVVESFNVYAKQVEKVDNLIAKGKLPANAVVSADFRTALPKAIAAINKAGGTSIPAIERAAIVEKALTDAGIKNPTVISQLTAALVNEGESYTVSKLKPIVQKLVIPGTKLEKGFIATRGPGVRAELPSLATAAEAGAIATTKPGAPVLGAVGSALKRAGLGLEDQNTAQFGIIRDNFSKNVEGVPGVVNKFGSGEELYKALTEYANSKQVGDIRQLMVSEIMQATDLERSAAKAIRGKLDAAFLGVNAATRGLAPKLQDANLKYNPLARGYARVQGSLRYRLNPAFKAQQVIEARTLGATYGTGSKDLQTIVGKMRAAELLPANPGTNFVGETIDNVAGLPRVTQHLFPKEETALASTLVGIAKKNGQTVDELLKDEQTRQIIRSIVQYPSKGVLSSNLAKGLNLAVFPLTYNVKVATMAAKALTRANAAEQFAVIKGVADFKKFLGTDQGIRWQSDNSELLGLISYFTPINSIQQIYDAVANKNPRSLGLVGGLPFGVISRVLEGQGLVGKTQPPYVDPKTGAVVPDKIPQTTKARVNQALRDMLDTVFTYPGRQAGLGSKSDLIKTLTGGILTSPANEVKSVDRSADLSAGAKHRSDVLKANRNMSGPTTPTPEAIAPLSVPKLKAPTITPIYKGTKVGKPKTRAKRPGEAF